MEVSGHFFTVYGNCFVSKLSRFCCQKWAAGEGLKSANRHILANFRRGCGVYGVKLNVDGGTAFLLGERVTI